MKYRKFTKQERFTLRTSLKEILSERRLETWLLQKKDSDVKKRASYQLEESSARFKVKLLFIKGNEKNQCVSRDWSLKSSKEEIIERLVKETLVPQNLKEKDVRIVSRLRENYFGDEFYAKNYEWLEEVSDICRIFKGV